MKKYTIIKQLGQGCFGSAYKVLNKEDNQIYAMKKIPKHRINKEEAKEAQNEAKILSRVSNEHIVKYYESFYSKYQIMDKAGINKLNNTNDLFDLSQLDNYSFPLNSMNNQIKFYDDNYSELSDYSIISQKTKSLRIK